MKFLKKHKEKVGNIEGVTTNSAPPSYWTTTGNYVVNKILSGSFNKGVGQGRVLGIVGPSGCLPDGEMVEIYIMKTITADTPINDEVIED